MSETKRVVLRVPVDLPADGLHCGDCDMVWPHARWYCSAWGESPLEEDEGGLLRCEQCRAAEERVKTQAQIEALLDAGGHLQQIVDDEIADCSGCGGTGTVDWTDGDYCGPCPDCAEARAAYRAWDRAVAGLAAEELEQPESPAPYPLCLDDLEVESFRLPGVDLSGPDNGVRITHRPTGLRAESAEPKVPRKRNYYLALKKLEGLLAASPAPICDACGPEGCRCEEDRR